MAEKAELVAGLDIGTTKICAMVGQISSTGEIEIVGMGSHPSRGLRKGVVVNIEATVEAIRQAVGEAEMMAGCEIGQVFAGIAGSHIRGINSHGIVPVKDREVDGDDIHRVIDAARAIAIPTDREVLHILPQAYIIDDQDGIREPLGMSGVRLEAKVHIVTAASTSAHNIVKCAERCGLQVTDMVLEQLASSQAVLSADEKELGVVLVDIGGGTTDVAIWADGSIVHTSVLPLGGDHITHDIAVGARTPTEEAERIKRAHGRAHSLGVQNGDSIEVSSMGGRSSRQLPLRMLAEIIEPRVEEIFSLVAKDVRRTGYQDLLASGAVITGGATLLPATQQVAEQVLGLPTRCGQPAGLSGLSEVIASPMYATAVGLVMYGRDHRLQRYRTQRPRNVLGRVTARLSHWLADIF